MLRTQLDNLLAFAAMMQAPERLRQKLQAAAEALS
jgi:hypothetical protein